MTPRLSLIPAAALVLGLLAPVPAQAGEPADPDDDDSTTTSDIPYVHEMLCTENSRDFSSGDAVLPISAMSLIEEAHRSMWVSVDEEASVTLDAFSYLLADQRRCELLLLHGVTPWDPADGLYRFTFESTWSAEEVVTFPDEEAAEPLVTRHVLHRSGVIDDAPPSEDDGMFDTDSRALAAAILPAPEHGVVSTNPAVAGSQFLTRLGMAFERLTEPAQWNVTVEVTEGRVDEVPASAARVRAAERARRVAVRAAQAVHTRQIKTARARLVRARGQASRLATASRRRAAAARAQRVFHQAKANADAVLTRQKTAAQSTYRAAVAPTTTQTWAPLTAVNDVAGLDTALSSHPG